MLNYEYIEQLIDKYFDCQTTLEEEVILREFFAQDNVPVDLLKYRQIFLYEQCEKHVDTLGSDFDEKIMAEIDANEPTKALTISLSQRLRPLLRAAAIVAMFITFGTAVETSLDSQYPEVKEVTDIPHIKKEGRLAVTDTLKKEDNISKLFYK